MVRAPNSCRLAQMPEGFPSGCAIVVHGEAQAGVGSLRGPGLFRAIIGDGATRCGIARYPLRRAAEARQLRLGLPLSIIYGEFFRFSFTAVFGIYCRRPAILCPYSFIDLFFSV